MIIQIQHIFTTRKINFFHRRIMSSCKTISIEAWQEGCPLPNTVPNSTHYGLNLGCAKCGALVVRDEEIVAIKNGSVWTKPTLEFVEFSDTSSSAEKEVRCEDCHCILGSYYMTKPTTNDPSMNEWFSSIQFPSAKIMYLRQSSSGTIFNKTILVGEESITRKGISDLSLVSSLPKVNL